MYEVSSKSDNGKVVKYTGKISQGGGGNLGGEFLKKKWISTKWGCKISAYTKFHPNRTMGKWSNIRVKIFWGGISQGEGGNLGGEFWKKKKTYKMGLQNKRIYKISSKSNKGKVVKYTGKNF